MKKYLLISAITVLYILTASSSVFALADGSPSSPDMPSPSGFLDFQKERGDSIAISIGTESVLKKPFKDDDSATGTKLEGNYLLLGVGYRINRRIEPYVRIGGHDMDLTFHQNGNKVVIDGKLVYVRRHTDQELVRRSGGLPERRKNQ